MSKKKNDNFLEELKKYFKETPKEKILEDWEKSKELDNVGVSVEEFLKETNKHFNNNE
jgi:hypothetical protein